MSQPMPALLIEILGLSAWLVALVVVLVPLERLFAVSTLHPETFGVPRRLHPFGRSIIDRPVFRVQVSCSARSH